MKMISATLLLCSSIRMKTIMRKHKLYFLFCLMGLIISPLPATAEWNVDLYGGGSFTMNHDVTTSSLGATAIASSVCPIAAMRIVPIQTARVPSRVEEGRG